MPSTQRHGRDRYAIARSASAAVVGVAVALATVTGAASPFGAPAVGAVRVHTDDAVPSWSEVQHAKSDARRTRAAIDSVTRALVSLREASNRASMTALADAAASQRAQKRLERAQQRAASLRAAAHTAAGEADRMRRTSGVLAAQLLRVGGQDPTVAMLLSPGDADDLLYRMGTMARLTDKASRSAADAESQGNLAAALAAQADAAAKVRARAASEAASALATATSGARAAQRAVASYQERSDDLVAKLASLKRTSEQAVKAELADKVDGDAGKAAGGSDGGADSSTPGAGSAPAGDEADSGSSGLGGSGGGQGPGGGPEDDAGSGAGSGSDDGADSTAPPPGMTVDPAAAQAYASSAIGAYGWGSAEMTCLVSLWNRESGWRADAYNTASGAYGIPQAWPADRMSQSGADWLTNAHTQIDWGLGYIKQRYGSPCAAWAHSEKSGWY